MLGQLIWWSSIALEMPCWREVSNGWPFGCRFLFVYRFVIFQDWSDSPLPMEVRPLQTSFLSTEFLGLAIGSLVVLRSTGPLRLIPGAARMARNALAVVFLVALVKGVLDVAGARPAGKRLAAPEIERVLRVVQAQRSWR